MSGFVDEDGLQANQKIVIAELIRGKSITSACETGGVARWQYYEWLRNCLPFVEALETAKVRAWQEIMMRPAFLAEKSFNTLAELCSSDANSKNANIRIRAASILLETLWKASQVSMLDQRLSAIEEALGIAKPDYTEPTAGTDRKSLPAEPTKPADPDNEI